MPEAASFRAPGRVNLIGEHTDYNGGYVLPAAIHFSTTARFEPRPDRQFELRSAQFPDAATFSLDDASPRPDRHWTNYPRGVALALASLGVQVAGARLSFTSDVPMGAGLSSSAALEISTALALLHAAGRGLPPMEIARACQRAEAGFVGLRCGIMDQFISLHGRTDHAVLLDCQSLENRPIPIPAGIRIVIANTMVHHELAGSEYNLRRRQCEQAAQAMGIASLRDAATGMLEAEMPDIARRRARHIVSENARVLQMADALEAGRRQELGPLMAASHVSLRDDYEVSCPELDLMVEAAGRLPGLIGARMTGGGFGGCTVNLVEADRAEAFAQTLAERYQAATGRRPDVFITQASSGAERIA
ncbi:MAG: galactokinase [Acidobacteria bacterium]|nr:galactokinase [Acidobacteriota bacterium]